MANHLIEKYSKMLKDAEGDKQKMEKAFDAVIKAKCGLILGRSFLETTEAFLNRKPLFKEFFSWTEQVTVSPTYQIINS